MIIYTLRQNINIDKNWPISVQHPCDKVAQNTEQSSIRKKSCELRDC